MKTKYIMMLLLMILSYLPVFAYAQDQSINLTNGEIIYKRRCSICHIIDNNRNRIGPSLNNIIGRKAGALPNFNYSSAMKQAGNQGLVWNKDNLIKYLSGPQAMIKGNRMANIPFTKNENLDDLIAYIAKTSSINAP